MCVVDLIKIKLDCVIEFSLGGGLNSQPQGPESISCCMHFVVFDPVSVYFICLKFYLRLQFKCL